MRPSLTNAQQATIEIENEAGNPIPVVIADEPVDVAITGEPIEITVVGDSVWTVELQADETENDNDKTFTVPADTEWQVLWVWVEFAANGNAGTRQLQIDFRDGADDVIGQQRPNATQATGETRYYMFGPSLANLTAFYDTDHLQTPLPPTIFLPAGYDIRIFDNNNVSATDDMVIQVMVASRDV
jgi:hypothetical protein